MKIKSKFAFVIAISALCVGTYYVVDRLVFLQNAERTFSKVRKIDSVNSRCGGRHKHSCTKFYATLDFVVEGRNYSIKETAGRKRGHNRSVDAACLHIGERVRVIYNARNPSKAYRDTFWSVWGNPISAVMVHLAFLLGSFSEQRRFGTNGNG